MTVLHTPLQLGAATIRNRLYRAPVLEGAGSGEGAAEAYAKHFVENAKHGVGLIIQGNSCIYEEGRTSPGMTLVNTRERMLALRPMVEAVHLQGASIFIQIGHGGLYAMEAWHEPYASQRKHPILAVSPLPRLVRQAFRGVPIHVMTTDEVRAMAVRFGDAAAWAREAGYDGIQLASANAKRLDQFLSPFYNRRTDEFGGSLENRMRFPLAIFDACRAVWPAHKPMSVRISAVDWLPGGISPADAVDVAALLVAHGCDIVDVSAGQTVHDQRPVYGRLFQTPFADRIRQDLGVATMAVGNISSYMDVNTIVASGRADLCLLARAHLFDPYWTRHAAWMQDWPLAWPDPYKSVERYTPRFEFRFTGDK